MKTALKLIVALLLLSVTACDKKEESVSVKLAKNWQLISYTVGSNTSNNVEGNNIHLNINAGGNFTANDSIFSVGQGQWTLFSDDTQVRLVDQNTNTVKLYNIVSLEDDEMVLRTDTFDIVKYYFKPY